MTFGDIGRRRQERVNRPRVSAHEEFINPYPWMSEIDAMVHLYLEDKGVPFSYRYFDGESVHLLHYMPDWHPEFTLREYKLCIVVLGNYFSEVPGIIDRNALAQVLLQEDGWKVVVLFEDEIRTRLPETMEQKAPELVRAAIKGQARPSPFGLPDFMARRIQYLKALALRRKTSWLDPERKTFNRDRFAVRRPLRSRGNSRSRWRVRS